MYTLLTRSAQGRPLRLHAYEEGAAEVHEGTWPWCEICYDILCGTLRFQKLYSVCMYFLYLIHLANAAGDRVIVFGTDSNPFEAEMKGITCKLRVHLFYSDHI
jgi:hypothetical protein